MALVKKAQAGAPINAGQLPAILQEIFQIQKDTQALMNFAAQANQLANSQYLFTIPGTAETVQMTAQQQTDMLTAYTQLKANIQNDINALP
jgi:hypothetical protein